MMKKEYPKALYLSGWDDLGACVVVLDAEEESAARKDGYRMLTEQVGPQEAVKRRRKAE